MFVKQATTDRLLGMLVTLATAGALYLIQYRLKAFIGGGRRRGGGGDRRRGKAAKKAADYGDPYFRARWGGKRGGGLELVQHKGQCMCGRFCFRLLAPPDVRALDCPGRIRYPHIFVPAGAFTPLSDLRLLTLYSARSPLVAHVVVHAFCSACGVPVFRASDGAIDTLVVNIECLASDGIRSLEVAYYEDLLGFPPEDGTAAAAAHGQQQQQQSQQQPPPYPVKGAAPFSASKGPRRTSPFRPPAPAASAGEAGPDGSSGAIVPFQPPRDGGSPKAGGGGWTGVLPIRLFGSRSVAPGGRGGLSGLVRTSGATSLLAHLLSRASLATGQAVGRPTRALRQRAVDEDDEDDEELEMAAAAAAAAAAASGQKGEMWRAWDESCDVHARRAGSAGMGMGLGVGARWASSGAGGGGSRPGSALAGALGPASTSTVGTAGAASSLGGALTSARAAAGGASFTNTSNYYRAAAQGNGWERLEGCTPPSMHQLRYHLKRHIKRRMNWLHDPDFAALCLDSDEEEDVGPDMEQAHQHHQHQHHLRPPSRQRRLAEEEGEYMAGGGSPAPSEGPHPTTPLGDRTASYANHPGSSGSVGAGNAAGAGAAALKAAEQQRRRGAVGGSGGTPRGGGRENSAPPAVVVGAGPGIAPAEKGKKED